MCVWDTKIKMRSLLLTVLVMLCVGAASASAEEPDSTYSTQMDDDYFEEVPSTHMPHLLSSSSLVEATVGESVKFPCDVDDLGDFVVLWNKGKNHLLFAGEMRITRNDRVTIENTTLRISSVQPKDSGEYSCQISTNPPLELSHSLDVLYPPSIKARPKDGFVTAKEGETVTLSCDASGNPIPTITWKHAGRNYDSTDGNTYIINNAQKSDSGEYECIADNSIGNPASAVITVEVVAAPKVYTEPRSGFLNVKEGEAISISCEATGDPAPVITWKKHGGEKIMKVREENKIVISEANRSHAGSYECIANNSLGIFTSAVIKVQVSYAPEVQVPSSWIHAGEGTNVNISCIVQGEPVPSVIWKKDDGQVLQYSEHYHLFMSGHTHMLQVQNLKEEDFGRYECSARNSLGSASQSVHIIGTPQLPVITSKPHGSQGTKYTISWTVNSHTPVDEYTLMYKKSGEGDWKTKTIPASSDREDTLHTQMYQLVDLEPATSYEAVVSARNKFGWSKQSDALIFRTKMEEKHSESISSSSTCLISNVLSLFPVVLGIYLRNL